MTWMGGWIQNAGVAGFGVRRLVAPLFGDESPNEKAVTSHRTPNGVASDCLAQRDRNQLTSCGPQNIQITAPAAM